MQGLIIGNISNIYNVKIDDNIYECNARGIFKKDKISPVVGDIVEVEVLDKNNKTGIINEIFPRKNYIKRPKLSNISQIILVLSSKMPKPDFLMLDKQLAYAEYLNIDVAIIVNKIDLDNKEVANVVKNIYEKIGYKIIYTNANTGEGIGELKKVLKNKISAFSGNSGVRKIYTNK